MRCPFHREATPSAHITFSSFSCASFYCRACKIRLPVVDFVWALEKDGLPELDANRLRTSLTQGRRRLCMSWDVAGHLQVIEYLLTLERDGAA